jgi:hypothetical protein
MLIDFSDFLQVPIYTFSTVFTLPITIQVNVFELGHTYLQLVQTPTLRLPRSRIRGSGYRTVAEEG